MLRNWNPVFDFHPVISTHADKCEYAVLSMIDKDNLPYCVPVSIVRNNDIIYFHGAKERKKTDSIKNNPNVCMSPTVI